MRKVIYLKFFSLFIVLTVIFSFSKRERGYREYFERVYIADSLFYAGKYKESSLIYKEVFSKYRPINFTRFKEYEFYLRSLYLSNKRDELNKGVHLLVTEYGYDFNRFRTDSILYNIFLKSDVDMHDFKFMREKYLKGVNKSLRNRIIGLVEEDSLNKLSNGEKERKDSIKKKLGIELYNFILKEGFPNEKLIGHKNIDYKNIEVDNIILYSMDDSIQKLLEPIIVQEFERGHIDSYKYASFIDFFRRRRKEPQDYGVYGGYEIRSNVNINRERKLIGLEPQGSLIKTND